MGKKTIHYLLIILLSFACNSTDNTQEIFYLKGELNAKDGTKIYLKSQEFNEIIPIDTSTLKNKVFSFSGHLNRPVVYGIYIENLPGVLGIVMENDSIHIKINPQDITKSIIKGSTLHSTYHDFLKKSFAISSKIDQLYPLFQKARAEDNFKKLKAINDQMKKIQQESEAFAINFARNNPDSYIAAYALHTVITNANLPVDSIKKVYDNFTPFVKKGDFSLEILHYIIENDSLH